MKQLVQFIQEKLKINSNSKVTKNKEKSSLWNSLDSLIRCKEDAVIFDDEDIQKEYHVADMTISYNYDTKWLTLDKIIIRGHNQGYGTTFMNDLCEWLDKNKAKICLTPTNAFGSNVNKLRKFYKRFGFVENTGKHSDFTTREKMYRYYNS